MGILHWLRPSKRRLAEAIRHADVKRVASLLKEEPHLANATLQEGMTPLHLAADWWAKGRTEVAEMLLDAGARVNVFDKRSRTPLHTAVESLQLPVARLLLARGADANAQHGFTPLHQAWAPPIMRLLLEHGADVNARSPDGATPLHEAAQQGCINAVRVLLCHGADIDAKTTNGQRAADWASLGVVGTVMTMPGLDERTRADVAALATLFLSRRPDPTSGARAKVAALLHAFDAAAKSMRCMPNGTMKSNQRCRALGEVCQRLQLASTREQFREAYASASSSLASALGEQHGLVRLFRELQEVPPGMRAEDMRDEGKFLAGQVTAYLDFLRRAEQATSVEAGRAAATLARPADQALTPDDIEANVALAISVLTDAAQAGQVEAVKLLAKAGVAAVDGILGAVAAANSSAKGRLISALREMLTAEVASHVRDRASQLPRDEAMAVSAAIDPRYNGESCDLAWATEQGGYALCYSDEPSARYSFWTACGRAADARERSTDRFRYCFILARGGTHYPYILLLLTDAPPRMGAMGQSVRGFAGEVIDRTVRQRSALGIDETELMWPAKIRKFLESETPEVLEAAEFL